jgi:hypothetical protein
MQRSQPFQSDDLLFYIGVDERRRIEIRSAVDYPHANTVKVFKDSRRISAFVAYHLNMLNTASP